MRNDDFDLAALRRGDRSAWNAFVGRYAAVIHAAVLGILRHSGRDTGEAGDLAQDVFMRLCKDGCRLLGTYDESRASLVTWLTVVGRSVALDHVRRKRVGTVDLDSVPEAALAVAPATTERVAIPPGLLSPRQALVMTLLYDRDLDPAEVAAMLGIDPQTVRSMHHKALVKLREHFAAQDGDETRG